MEDEYREVKKWGETRIPAGKYEVTLRTWGRIHENYLEKFPFHKGTLWVRNVPGFKYILIHIGNTDRGTAGCILVGQKHEINKNFIGKSTVNYEAFYKQVIAAFDRGEKVYIHVVDELKG